MIHLKTIGNRTSPYFVGDSMRHPAAVTPPNLAVPSSVWTTAICTGPQPAPGVRLWRDLIPQSYFNGRRVRHVVPVMLLVSVNGNDAAMTSPSVASRSRPPSRIQRRADRVAGSGPFMD